jgi:hypothetical protein
MSQLKIYLNKVFRYIEMYNLIDVLVLGFLSAQSLIFLNQSNLISGFVSDFHPHVRFTTTLSDGGYSLMHIVVHYIAEVFVFFNSSLSVSFEKIVSNVLALLLSISVFTSYKLICNYFKFTNSLISVTKLKLTSLIVLLVSMLIYDFRINGIHYLSSLTPNPLHNPTYLFSKPFAIITFILYSKILLKIRSNEAVNKKLLIAATISAFLCMWAKPSFLISFVPAYFIINLFLFFEKKDRLILLLVNFTTFLPSIIPLYIIKVKTFNNSPDAAKVIISFAESWSYLSDNIIFSIFLAAALPLFIISIYFIHYNSLKDQVGLVHKLAFMNYIIAILVYLFLAETGLRSNHANFGWTYCFSLFFLFLMSVELILIRKVFKHFAIVEKVSLLLLFMHLLSGLYYFTIIFFGHQYR